MVVSRLAGAVVAKDARRAHAGVFSLNCGAMSDRYALILAGGGGTRLWPASRRRQPKQLLTLGGPETLLAATFRRAATLVGSPERVLVGPDGRRTFTVHRSTAGLLP